MANPTIIRARQLHDGIAIRPLRDQAVVCEGGRIVRICPFEQAPAGLVVADADVAMPGLIDLQINGAGGVQFNDNPSVQGLATMAAAARKGGAAWILPTFISDAGTQYRLAMEAVTEAVGSVPGIIGLHLEGPFLSPARPGIHRRDLLRPIDESDMANLLDFGHPLMVTLAPETCTSDVLQRLSQAGIRVFAGHSEATFEHMRRAEDCGLTGVTHLFNAMSQMQGRAPNVVGAVLASDGLYAGLIADGHHVHPANLKIASQALLPNRLFLVTDAMCVLGTDQQSFSLLGQEIYRGGGRLVDAAGTLAGADLTMIEAVRNLRGMTGCTLAAAIAAATRVPATVMGMQEEIGTLKVGARAGLTLTDTNLGVQAVCIDGHLLD